MAVIEIVIAVRGKKVLGALSLVIVQSNDIERVVALMMRFRRISRRRLATFEQTVAVACRPMDGIEVVQHFVTYQSIDTIDIQRMSIRRHFLPVRGEECHTLQNQGCHSQQYTANQSHGSRFPRANISSSWDDWPLRGFLVGG